MASAAHLRLRCKWFATETLAYAKLKHDAFAIDDPGVRVDTHLAGEHGPRTWLSVASTWSRNEASRIARSTAEAFPQHELAAPRCDYRRQELMCDCSVRMDAMTLPCDTRCDAHCRPLGSVSEGYQYGVASTASGTQGWADM